MATPRGFSWVGGEFIVDVSKEDAATLLADGGYLLRRSAQNPTQIAIAYKESGKVVNNFLVNVPEKINSLRPSDHQNFPEYIQTHWQQWIQKSKIDTNTFDNALHGANYNDLHVLSLKKRAGENSGYTLEFSNPYGNEGTVSLSLPDALINDMFKQMPLDLKAEADEKNKREDVERQAQAAKDKNTQALASMPQVQKTFKGALIEALSSSEPKHQHVGNLRKPAQFKKIISPYGYGDIADRIIELIKNINEPIDLNGEKIEGLQGLLSKLEDGLTDWRSESPIRKELEDAIKADSNLKGENKNIESVIAAVHELKIRCERVNKIETLEKQLRYKFDAYKKDKTEVNLKKKRAVSEMLVQLGNLKKQVATGVHASDHRFNSALDIVKDFIATTAGQFKKFGKFGPKTRFARTMIDVVDPSDANKKKSKL